MQCTVKLCINISNPQVNDIKDTFWRDPFLIMFIRLLTDIVEHRINKMGSLS